VYQSHYFHAANCVQELAICERAGGRKRETTTPADADNDSGASADADIKVDAKAEDEPTAAGSVSKNKTDGNRSDSVEQVAEYPHDADDHCQRCYWACYKACIGLVVHST